MAVKKWKGGYSGDNEVGESMKTVYRNNVPYQEPETLADVNKYPVVAVAHRGLTLEAAKIFGVRSSLSEQDGKTVTASYFPYYNKTGDLIAYKKRDWTVPKEDTARHFSVVGNLKINCLMFHQQDLSKNCAKKIYVTEGEEDCIALHMSILESVK